MEKNIINKQKLEKIHEILENIFIDEDIDTIKSLENFDELEDWDSINQMTLAYQIEKLLNTDLKTEEVESIKSYSSITELVLKKNNER